MAKITLPPTAPRLQQTEELVVLNSDEARDMHALNHRLICPEKTRTDQSFAEEADINYIANKFGLTGQLPVYPDGFMWGDVNFETTFDFQTAQNALVAGKAAFMELPAKVRARFNHDPQELMEFLRSNDAKDVQEARLLGLVKEPEPEPTPPVPEAPKAP